MSPVAGALVLAGCVFVAVSVVMAWVCVISWLIFRRFEQPRTAERTLQDWARERVRA